MRRVSWRKVLIGFAVQYNPVSILGKVLPASSRREEPRFPGYLPTRCRLHDVSTLMNGGWLCQRGSVMVATILRRAAMRIGSRISADCSNDVVRIHGRRNGASPPPDFLRATSGTDQMNEHFDASCLCGGVRLEYSGRIGPSNYCHCEDCRRANGSAFNIGVRVDRRDLTVNATTELKSYRMTGGTGRVIERCFCGTCGSPIFTLHPDKPEYAWVKAGIIHQSEIVKPAYENWTRDKVKWANIDVPESHEESRRA
jgi:hypothetical protein